jgi:uncharacterized protein (TIGR02145 family)
MSVFCRIFTPSGKSLLAAILIVLILMFSACGEVSGSGFGGGGEEIGDFSSSSSISDAVFGDCSKPNVLGNCFFNGLRRCKQLGDNSEKYIVDLLPGMICDNSNNGIITGSVRSESFNTTNKIYNTVQIGKQVWITENLNEMPEGVCYENDNLNCEIYGRLYFSGDENSGGLCPPGFRSATQGDWQNLIEYAGGASIAGKRLKSKTGWNSGNGTDSYGFNAKPGGFGSFLNTQSQFQKAGEEGIWWAGSREYIRIISSDDEVRNHFVDNDLVPRDLFGSYVRCLHE